MIRGHGGETHPPPSSFRRGARARVFHEHPSAGYRVDGMPAADDPSIEEWLRCAGMVIASSNIEDRRDDGGLAAICDTGSGAPPGGGFGGLPINLGGAASARSW